MVMSIQAGKQGVGTSPGHGISLTQNPGGYKLGPFECSNVLTRIPGQNVLTRNPGHLH